jgi:hypothetical protein
MGKREFFFDGRGWEVEYGKTIKILFLTFKFGPNFGLKIKMNVKNNIFLLSLSSNLVLVRRHYSFDILCIHQVPYKGEHRCRLFWEDTVLLSLQIELRLQGITLSSTHEKRKEVEERKELGEKK